MKRDDVVADGRLVLAAVIVGSLLTSGGPALSKLLTEVLARWLAAK